LGDLDGLWQAEACGVGAVDGDAAGDAELSLHMEPLPAPPAMASLPAVVQAWWQVLDCAPIKKRVLDVTRAQLDYRARDAVAVNPLELAQLGSPPPGDGALLKEVVNLANGEGFDGLLVGAGGLHALSLWRERYVVPSYVRDVNHPQAGVFYRMLVDAISGGMDMDSLSATVGIPEGPLLKFLRSRSAMDGGLQDALDDFITMTSAQYARFAADPRVGDDVAKRAKEALAAQRDLVLRLKESRFASATVQQARIGAHISGGGGVFMSIDFTFSKAGKTDTMPAPTDFLLGG
jgi:hypothetical protein